MADKLNSIFQSVSQKTFNKTQTLNSFNQKEMILLAKVIYCSFYSSQYLD